MDCYGRWQVVIFVTIFVGYSMYCLNRKSFTYLLAFILEDTNVDKKDLGIVTSSITLSYAFSKFASSIISDSVSPRVQFSAGLFIVGLATLQFSASSTITTFAVIYFMNGIGQGSGWPPCVKLLKQWFSPSQLGFLWSVLSTSGNVAGIGGPLLLPYVALSYGWRVAMWCAGVCAITVACLAASTVRNKPADVGLTPNNEKQIKYPKNSQGKANKNSVKESQKDTTETSERYEELKDEQTSSKEKDEIETKEIDPSSSPTKQKRSRSSQHDRTKKRRMKSSTAENSKKSLRMKDEDIKLGQESSKQDVLSSPFLWVLSFLFFIIRFETASCEDWCQLYLVQEKGFPVTIGSTFLSAMAVGAVFGSISSGYVTDRMVAREHRVLVHYWGDDSMAKEKGEGKIQTKLKLRTMPSVLRQLEKEVETQVNTFSIGPNEYQYGILRRGSARYSLVLLLVTIDLFAIHCFRSYVTKDSSLAFIHLLAVLMGACQFSCFAIYGVLVVEHSPSHLTGTSHGLAALFANLGGVMAGYPMSYLSKHYDWSTVYFCVEMASLAGLVTVLLTRSIPSTIGKRTKLHKM